MEENPPPAKPVMDIAPPKAPDVHPDPSEEKPDAPAGSSEKPDQSASKSMPAAASKKSMDDKGVGMAIAGTVVIVLGLAVIAAYAYLKTR